ncbi:MAG: ribosomal protein [Phycisphaerales bacterium]|jgi:large subunit ribosomal protein L6|nr:ribosomal protein [Phycisphaerales bacterium]MDB5305145.1 ribosomal protein [Phycisphaerales bacterium]
MSRIGKKPVPVTAGVKVAVQNQLVRLEGPKGKLELNVHPAIDVKFDDAKKELVVGRPNDERQSKALHGLTRSLLNNMVIGVTLGYKKTLEIQGVGYKAELRGKNLVLSVGYANQITLSVPTGVTVAMEGATKMHVSGVDKQLVGQFAAEVRSVRKPEPYKGKGIRYEGETVKIKPGKAFAGTGK